MTGRLRRWLIILGSCAFAASLVLAGCDPTRTSKEEMPPIVQNPKPIRISAELGADPAHVTISISKNESVQWVNESGRPVAITFRGAAGGPVILTGQKSSPWLVNDLTVPEVYYYRIRPLMVESPTAWSPFRVEAAWAQPDTVYPGDPSISVEP